MNALSKRSSSCARSVARELVLGLVGEADQEVGRERDAGHRRAQVAEPARGTSR